MLDARLHLPSRGFSIAVVLLTATTSARIGAQPTPTATKKTTTQIVGTAAQQAAAQQAAAQQAAISLQQPPAPIQWAAPKPCGGTSVYSHGRVGVAPTVPALQNNSAQTARAVLRKLGLHLDERFVRGAGAPDAVIAQSPPLNTPVARGDTVIACFVLPTRFPDVVHARVAVAQRVLSDSGFRAFVIDSIVMSTKEIGIVLRQQPIAGSIAPLGTVDTLLVGLLAPPTPIPTRPMPKLDSATYVQADNALRALNAFTNNQLLIRWQSASGGSYTTPGSIVVAQRPSAGTPVKAGDAILVVLRDTTTQLPPLTTTQLPPLATTQVPPPTTTQVPPPTMTQVPPPRMTQLPPPTTTQLPTPATTVPMPKLDDRPMSSAMATLQRLRRRVPFSFRRGLIPSGTLPFDSTHAVVDSQSPAAGALLSAQSIAVLIFRDTTAAQTPPPPVTIMPNVVGRTVRQARDTLFILGIPFRATATDNEDNAGDTWIVQSQSRPAGDTVIATTTVRLYAANPATPIPWLWIALGVTAFLAAVGATLYVKTGNQRLARMAVVPHVDPIPPRVKFTMRGGETAEDAFGRIGLTFTPMADRGTVTRLTLTPLDEDRHG